MVIFRSSVLPGNPTVRPILFFLTKSGFRCIMYVIDLLCTEGTFRAAEAQKELLRDSGCCFVGSCYSIIPRKHAICGLSSRILIHLGNQDCEFRNTHHGSDVA